jgi:hypothetical protein
LVSLFVAYQILQPFLCIEALYKEGGFSAIAEKSTDSNNMGGFFVRKVAGAGGCAVHLHKILPFLFHEPTAQWIHGHFRPLLYSAVVANLSLMVFYAAYHDDLSSNRAWELPLAMLATLALETLAMMHYLYTSRNTKRGPAISMPNEKTPSSPVSNIVTRTVLIVSTVMGVVAGRDLFFPGMIIPLLPRDDIYLEWTNAFFHSPPDNSPESVDQGLEAPLYVGDRFVSQLAALNILILCLYKLTASLLVRLGADCGGSPKARMIWKGSFLGDAFLLFTVRCFVHAATSASLNLKWHLIFLSYEAFILGIYGFF